MSVAVVGAARVVFGADASEFDRTAGGVQNTLRGLVDKFEDVERRIRQVGAAATLGITVPFAAMIRAVDRGAGSFESQMKRVEAALGSVSGDDLKTLSDQARTLGPAVGKSATEAAGAIEALGLAGVSTADIMGGALKAALDLSAAGMVDASASSSLVTDVMAQFKATASDLPNVVQNVVGALDSSKFGFDDFRLAVGQGGAVAASAGVDFLDFATAISATSTQFTSGADAGTSFKTYIQSLVGNSKQAKAAMQKLGISFFDVRTGEMKPLAEQAEILRKALGGLTDQSKTDALKTIFGSDASRTAIGLMEQGREGFERLQATVAGGDVAAKIQKRMEGTEAAGRRIANAWESVKIALALDTGLLDITSAIKNAFAALLEAIANAPPIFKQVGAAFAALSSLIGPFLILLGTVGTHLLAHFAMARFGLIGRAIAFIIAPISTIITLLGEYGLGRVLQMAAGRLLALLGPVGWAISAFLLFKDHIVAALGAVSASISATLGPPLEALFAKLGELGDKLSGLWARMSDGAAGDAVRGIIALLAGLRDVIGTALTAAILLAGEVIERALSAIVAAISGLVDIVSGVVDAVSALLSGDFSGAWTAIAGVIGSAVDTVVDILAALVPEIGAELRAVVEIAKAWLGDAFGSVITWMGESVRTGVDYVANTFPGIVSAAQSVYQGVKGWLVDKFGGLMTWIGNAAKWIGDKYAALKATLGLGGTVEVAEPAAPKEPSWLDRVKAAFAAPKRAVSFDDDEKAKRRGRRGRDTTHDAANRDQLAMDIELEAARLRGDHAAVEALQRRMDLSRQIEAYQRTGLSLAAATAAAQRDMAVLDAARAAGLARELGLDDAAHRLNVARIADNRTLVETLERQEEINRRIRGFEADGLSTVAATLRATEQQLAVDRARAEVRARMLRQDEQDRQLSLARARGDGEAVIRSLERGVWVRKRADELADGQTSAAEAQAQAEREWSEGDRARVTGEYRDAVKAGMQAAMNGDLKGFVSSWWRDRVARGMEDALNSLADLIQRLFAKAGNGATETGGGVGGLLGKVAGLFGGAKASAPTFQSIGDDTARALGGLKLPGFATGGSFRIGGRSGIDQNIVAFRGTVGETVDIRRPGAERTAPARPIIFDARGAVMTTDLLAQMEDIADERGGRVVQDYSKRQARAGRRRMA